MKNTGIFFAFSLFLLQSSFAQTSKLPKVAFVQVFSEQDYRGSSQMITSEGSHNLNFPVKSIKILRGYYAEVQGAECLGYGLLLKGQTSTYVPNHCGPMRVRKVNTANAALQFIIKTGGDDLRQNSVATVTVRFANGSSSTYQLNRLNNWPNGSTRTVNINLPQGTRPTDISGITLNFASGSSGPFDTGDNWNVDQVEVKYSCYNISATTIAFGRGTPLVRFTGSTRTYNVPLLANF